MQLLCFIIWAAEEEEEVIMWCCKHQDQNVRRQGGNLWSRALRSSGQGAKGHNMPVVTCHRVLLMYAMAILYEQQTNVA